MAAAGRGAQKPSIASITRGWLLCALWLLLLTGCSRPAAQLPLPTAAAMAPPPSTATATASPTASPTATQPAVLPPARPTARPTATPLPLPTATPTATLTPSPTPSGVVHLAAVGDIMLDRTLGNVISRGRIEYPFAAMLPWLAEPDLTVGNMESALGDIGEPVQGKSFPFRAPPGAAEALAAGGFDIVSLANNHAMDYGPEALLQGIDLLEKVGVRPVGAGRDRTAARAPAIVEANGLRLAFLAYVNVPVEGTGFDVESWEAGPEQPGLAWGRLPEMAADIAAVRDEVDHVVVILHSGTEYVPFADETQILLSRGAIDAGATVVIGHHAHILQGIEMYKDGLIAYGLGNFAFDIDGNPNTAVLHLWLDREGVRELEIIPAVIQVGGAPRPATAEEAAEIMAEIGPFTRRE